MEDVIYVEMLGGFAMYYRGGPVIEWQSRSSKLISILQHLIYHRGKSFSKEVFFDLFYDSDSITNPSNSLRVTFHRIRKLLADSGLPENQYIISRNGMCCWNEAIPCRTDVDDFEACVASASDPSRPAADRLSLYRKAFSLYKGEFLALSASESWVAVESVRLKKIYFSCVENLCRLLANEGYHADIDMICRKAISIYPYDEELRYLYVSLLVALERYRDALSAYEDCAKFFFDELGIEPSERLKECRKKIADKMPGGMVSVTEIKETLNHDDNGPGAYFANYLNFLENYRYAIRVVKRNRMSAFLMFCSLTDRSGLPLPDSEKLQEAANVLQNAIKASLRSGDLYTRYDRANFVVLLVGINQENCPIVSGRTDERFRASYRGKNVRLRFKFISAFDVDAEPSIKAFRSGKISW